MKPITVVYGLDAAFAPYASVSTHSLKAHATGPLNIQWLVPVADLEAVRPFQERLKAAGVEVELIGVDFRVFDDWPEVRHIKRSSYLRLLIPSTLKASRAIYLDGDTLVRADLRALFEIDLGDKWIAGVPDPGGDRTSQIPRPPGDPYLNAGVLLMDLDALRAADFIGECGRIRQLHREQVTWADQCLINKFAEGRKRVVEPDWNRLIFSRQIPPEQFDSISRDENSKILHFVGPDKPWSHGCPARIAEYWVTQAKRILPVSRKTGDEARETSTQPAPSWSRCEVRFDDVRRDFYYRPQSVADKGVLEQVFRQQAYRISQWPQGRRLMDHYRARVAGGARPLIVDAGANIGATAVWFQNHFPQAVIFALEPEQANARLLEFNTAVYPRTHVFKGAIGSRDGHVALVDPGMSDWGFRTVGRGSSASTDARLDVPCISPASILASEAARGTEPLIMKIDIEGAEQDLFQGDVDWMDEFAMIGIELHDWMLPFQGSSRTFLSALARFDFELIPRGENLFLFNRRLLRP